MDLLAENLCFSHPRRPVLRGCTLTAATGRAVALVGPSGSGKTTLLWLLAGLLRPEAGRVVLGDEARPPGKAARPRIGMVFQQPMLWGHLTVEGHLKLVLSDWRADRRQRGRRIDAILSRMRLGELRRRLPGELSGGERQRLAIARALVVAPDVLLLDEPLAHLDGEARRELFGLLAGTLTDTAAAAVLATHNAAEALRIADDVAVLLDGRIVQAGPAKQVYRHPVSLAAAVALGPACELAGLAESGRLVADGAVLLEGLDPARAGEVRLILRPEDVAFEPAAAGAAEVVAADFAGAAYRLRLTVAGRDLVALHTGPVPTGTKGRLRSTVK